MDFRTLSLALTLLFYAGYNTALAQKSTGVKVIGKATDRTIKIRWAPTTSALWHYANQYGYSIERITISVNNMILEKPVRKILNDRPIKPQPLAVWEASGQDDYVAIAAQSIFGEAFQLTDNFRSDVVQVMNKVQESESRYSFAMFSADQSVRSAELSGLYHEDHTIAPDTRYLYRVYANVPEEIVPADTGYVYLGLEDYTPLPALRDTHGEFLDQQVIISWNGRLFENIYNSYWVERSEDGKIFNRISERPIVNMFTGDNPKTDKVFKTDSLPSNNKIYYYIVRGVTPFGEIGPPSDTIAGFAKPSFNYTPTITKAFFNKVSNAEIEWSFPEKGVPLLEKFQLLAHDQNSKAYREIVSAINSDSRKTATPAISGAVYYVIKAVDRYGRSSNSFPYLLQSEDSIPPLAPVDLAGKIDTAGIVSLHWKPGTDKDLFGYHVFRANFLSDEFVQLPGAIQKKTTFIDTLELNTLTEKIYYKVRAYDHRFNASDFSAILELKKPDMIPPVPPVITQALSDSTGIFLRWNSSSSADVREHQLYRRKETEEEWSMLRIFESADSSFFVDKDVKHKEKYFYTLLAKDDDALESKPASPVSITWVNIRSRPPVERIFHTINKDKRLLNISWQYDQPGVSEFLLYRSANDQKLQFYRTLLADAREITERYSQSDAAMEFRIVAAFSTGERSTISKPVKIEF